MVGLQLFRALAGVLAQLMLLLSRYLGFLDLGDVFFLLVWLFLGQGLRVLFATETHQLLH